MCERWCARWVTQWPMGHGIPQPVVYGLFRIPTAVRLLQECGHAPFNTKLSSTPTHTHFLARTHVALKKHTALHPHRREGNIKGAFSTQAFLASCKCRQVTRACALIMSQRFVNVIPHQAAGGTVPFDEVKPRLKV